jgi:hypothetical protein
MDELAEKIDDLLLAQGDVFVVQLRELIVNELNGAIARQFGTARQAPLWPLEGSLPQHDECPMLFVAEVSPAVPEVLTPESCVPKRKAWSAVSSPAP